MTSHAQRPVVGVDIGGTHVTAAVVETASQRIVEASRTRVEMDSACPAHVTLCRWHDAIRGALDAAGIDAVDAVGIAMPGPFDYARGISAIRGLGKFESLFGVNVRQSLAGKMRIDPISRVVFRNDAECFALGEAWMGAGRGLNRVVAITLGTGLGSAFVRDGRSVVRGEEVPKSGWLYCVPFEGMPAEEHFSARGLLRSFGRISAAEVTSVAELAVVARFDQRVATLFEEFGARLGEFVKPWLECFDAQCLVVGGSIARSWDLFSEPLARTIGQRIAVRLAQLFEDAALCGAARIALEEAGNEAIDEQALIRDGRWRKTRQRLKPATKPRVADAAYDLYPALPLPGGQVHAGFDSIADSLIGESRVIIDGYVGVFFDDFRARLDAALRGRGVEPVWYEARAALRAPDEIETLVAPFLGGDDPLFGTRMTSALADFFDNDLLGAIRADRDATMSILIGPGAALAGWEGRLVYLDLPKNELQFRARAGGVTNVGAAAPAPPKVMYKRFYFVDWVVLNAHKERILPEVGMVVDTQRADEPTWMSGDDFRAALNRLSTNGFRVRPWFEPGPWGGQWIKENFTDLPADEPNYAWSFELIVPENGLIFQSDWKLLEVSFDWLMFAHHKQVIGESSSFFGHEFPIRFDYLDTVRGGNLSVQCHPRPGYIREEFGESFTQDETYYIHHADPGARVYLGFNEGIDAGEFRAALDRSAAEGVPVDIDRYVKTWPAKKHDLFLIPNGTIHCSGFGCLVLEISATPYIFTFKMYDWMRMDLDGKPRSLNIARAFDNLHLDRAGERAARELISNPRETARGQGWRIVHLPTHEEHFYDVRRYEFADRIEVPTDASCHVGNLVEGSRITVSTTDRSMQIAYGETFVVPAAAERYTLVNESGGEAKVVVAFVKAGYAFH